MFTFGLLTLREKLLPKKYVEDCKKIMVMGVMNISARPGRRGGKQ
jgi:hypothetical protein